MIKSMKTTHTLVSRKRKKKIVHIIFYPNTIKATPCISTIHGINCYNVSVPHLSKVVPY